MGCGPSKQEETAAREREMQEDMLERVHSDQTDAEKNRQAWRRASTVPIMVGPLEAMKRSSLGSQQPTEDSHNDGGTRTSISAPNPFAAPFSSSNNNTSEVQEQHSAGDSANQQQEEGGSSAVAPATDFEPSE